ncbi:MAG TPA: DUF3313 domain-containing protein [Hyphomicrobiaceae bacterium]
MVLRQVVYGVCVVALVGGCGATQQARDVETSGFLGEDYALLRQGGENESLLTYRAPDADWRAYDKIQLDPVTVWTRDGSAFKDASAAERQQLADDLYAAVYKELAEDYQMVSAPGPGVMRIQVALTDAQASNPMLDTVSTVMPAGLAVSGATGLVTGKPGFVGEARAEAKVTDATTGELLGAAADRRVGGKSLGGSIDSWDDADQAFQYWAEQFRYRLCTQRGDTDCEPPEA